MTETSLTHAQIQQFKIDGYLVLRGFVKKNSLNELRVKTKEHLDRRIPPFELETDVQYPGAPASCEEVGGQTIRRLLHAYDRDEVFKRYAENKVITGAIKQILASDHLLLNRNHHNCIMTKLPKFSSETLWHRDTRYWNFSDKYLINAWFALVDEQQANGGMKILPGSHRWDIQADAVDDLQFLKPDYPENTERLTTQRLVNLNAGDVLLFSAHCFHSAGRNTTDKPKYSMIFTYHSETTAPTDNTKSSTLSEITV